MPSASDNDKTVLRKFMQAHGFRDSSPIIPALTEEAAYASQLRRFEEVATGSGIGGRALSTASIAGYRSRLGTWHQVAVGLAERLNLPEGFTEALTASVTRACQSLVTFPSAANG